MHTNSTHLLFFTLSDDFNLKVEQDVQRVKSTDRRAVLTYRGGVVWMETVLIFTIQRYPPTFSSIPTMPVNLYKSVFHP